MDRVSGQFSRGIRRDSREERLTIASELAAARHAFEVAGIRVVIAIAMASGNDAITNGIDHALARALREATLHIAADSVTTRVLVRIWQDRDAGVVILDVVDDGRSFRSGDEGDGFRRLRHLVESLQGRLSLRAARADRGARLTVMLPRIV